MRRLFLSTLLIALVIGGIVSVSIYVNPAKAAANVTGIINSDTTWTKANSPYNLAGNVLVNNGVTLMIEPGVTVNFGSYYIMVNGTLRAQGSNTQKIQFNGGQVTFTQYSNSWNEQAGSGCIIENAIFSSTIISTSNAVKINKNTIDTGFTVDSATTISNNTIRGNVNGGILSGNTITGDVNSATISNNTITGQVSATGTVSNNTIKSGVTAIGNCIIANNTIAGGIQSSGDINGDGIYVGSYYVIGGGYPQIQNNLITNCTTGIDINILIRSWFSANIPQIQNNLITKNTIGIKFTINTQESYGDRDPTTIQNNTITQNTIGIKLVGNVQEYRIQNNNIQDNTNYNLALEGAPYSVNATYNWWGTTDTQIINQTIHDFKNDFNLGAVNFVPFLTKPNPTASAIPEPEPSPTPSPTQSPIPTPTSTPSPTPISTPTPSPTPTPTPTPTATPSPSPSPTPTPSPAPTPTPTPSPTLSFTPTPTPSSELTLGGYQTGIGVIILLVVVGAVVAVFMRRRKTKA